MPVASFKFSKGSAVMESVRLGLGSTDDDSCVVLEDIDEVRDLPSALRPFKVVGLTNGSG